MIQLKPVDDYTDLWIDEDSIIALKRYEVRPSRILLSSGEVEPHTTVFMRDGTRFEVRDTIEEIRSKSNLWP